MAAQILRQTVQFLHISVFPESFVQEIKICSSASGGEIDCFPAVDRRREDFEDINPDRTLRRVQLRWYCLRHAQSQCSHLPAVLL